MQIERHEIRVLSAVIEEGGFSRAAERLNVSQSAVSQAIANLEHKLNTALLVRGRVPHLTEAGLRLFRFAQTMINEERNALDDIQQIRQRRAVDAESRNEQPRQPFLREVAAVEVLRAQSADASEARRRAEPRDRLWRRRRSLGARLRPVPAPDAGPFRRSAAVSTEQRVLVAHRSHPRFDALINEPMKVLGEVTLITSYLDEATKRPGHERLRDWFASIWEVSHLELRLALLEAGKGVTFLSDRLLGELDGLVALPALEFGAIRRTVGIYYKKPQAAVGSGETISRHRRERVRGAVDRGRSLRRAVR